jgi:hypothetical protein
MPAPHYIEESRALANRLRSEIGEERYFGDGRRLSLPVYSLEERNLIARALDCLANTNDR